MVIDRPARQIRERGALRRDFGVALLVGISHDPVGIGDVKVFAHQRHAERRVQMIEKYTLGFWRGVAAMQQRDPVARSGVAAGCGPGFHPCHHAILRPRDRLGAGRFSTRPPECRHWAAHTGIAGVASPWPTPRFSIPARRSASRPPSSRRPWRCASAVSDIGFVRADWDAGRFAPWDRRPDRCSRPGQAPARPAGSRSKGARAAPFAKSRSWPARSYSMTIDHRPTKPTGDKHDQHGDQ